MRLLRASRQPLEEALDLLPDLAAAGEAPPAHADQSYQRVAVLDRHEEVVPRTARAVHEERLHVRLELAQHGVRALDLLPRVEVEQRLGRAGGARVVRDDSSRVRAGGEERHLDRDPQLLPRHVVELEAGQAKPPVGDEPVMPAAGRAPVEEDLAGAARAHELAVAQVEQVAVLGRYRLAAEVAVLELRRALFGGAPRHLTQPRPAHAAATGRRATFTSPWSVVSNGTGSSWS